MPNHYKAKEQSIGRKYGKLTVLSLLPAIKPGKTRVSCACECGSEYTGRLCDLKSGNTVSCGCANHLGPTKHGDAKKGEAAREYKIWAGIKQRTANPKHPAWKYYGGRGITMSPAWFHSYAEFIAYVGKAPDPLLTIDRINNDGNYEPGNVRWATRQTQAENRRKKQ